MDGADDVRAGEDEVLVAALEIGAAEIRRGQAAALDGRAHGPVQDQDAPSQQFPKFRFAPAIRQFPPPY